jgi:hypothetical protein
MRPLKPCGTRAAYQRHIANREVPCDACVAANRIDARARTEAVQQHQAERRAALDEVAAQTIWHGRRSA